MAHGHGLAPFTRNPAAATGSYLANVTAGQLAWDLLDFALTFISGSDFGAGAPTTARDMAATRTALRQGGKKTAQATEQAAARAQAQRLAESQAAHTSRAKRKGSHK